jgi:hypothetical protein
MNKITRFTTIAAFAFLVLGLPAMASAQYGNGGYGNGRGAYGGYGDVRSTVRNLKNNARQLERQIDRELDRGRYDGSHREDQINTIASRFEDAVSRLDNDDRQKRDEVRRVMETALQMDRALSRARLSYNVQNLWSAIERDLQVLGGYDSRNNRNTRGYPNGRNNRNNLPTWWPF